MMDVLPCHHEARQNSIQGDQIRTMHMTAISRLRPIRSAVSAVLLVLLASSLLGGSAVAADSWTVDVPVTVYAVATSTDGSITVAGRRDNSVIAYDAAGEQLWTFATSGTVYSVALSDDGQRIAVVSEDRHVYLLDGSGQELWNYRGRQTYLSVSISGDGQIIAAGSEDRTVSLFDASGNLTWQYTGGDHITQVGVYGGAGGFRVVAGSRDSRVSLLDGTGTLIWQATLNYSVRGLAVSDNGARIVAGDDRETVYLLDGGSGKVLWETSLGSPVPALDISGDGEVIAAGSSGGTLATFDAKGNRTSETGTGNGMTALSLTSDASFAAIAFDDRVALYPRAEGGGFHIPKPESSLAQYRLAILGGVIALVIVLGLIGLRKRPNGERTWQSVARQNRTLGREMWRARLSYLFLVPTISLLLLFNYYPAFSGIYHAFTEWSPGIETKWVGLKQFRDLGNNRYFWAGIGNLLILVITGFLKLIIPLAVAEMIFHVRNSKLGYAFRTLFVLQVIVPGVVGVLLWVNVYDPNIGLANQVLDTVGLGSLTRYWLGDADTAIWAIVFMGFPWVSAFALLIFYGGLISIPAELFDSAQLDGASTWRRILNIDLPLLLAQFRLLIILTFIATVQEFAAVFLTTGGGPGSSTYVPSLELYYQAVRFNNFGAASAIGAVLFIFILGGTILNLRYVKSSVEYGT
jgi:ABC-type sugar transport system permease subunit/outer membrane protein assembly factor BamB